LLESGDGEVQADGRTWRVVETRDVSRAPGFSHVRLSLIKDGSFHWAAAPPTAPVEWRYSLVFRDSPSERSAERIARHLVAGSRGAQVRGCREVSASVAPSVRRMAKRFRRDTVLNCDGPNVVGRRSSAPGSVGDRAARQVSVLDRF